MDDFLRVTRASGLVDSDRLDEAVAPWKDGTGKGVAGPVPEACIQAIIDRGLLTNWQMDQLRKGRHKGFVLGKYKLLRLLGTGGMSSVYLAEHMTLHNKVAIKVLPVKRIDQTSYLARFEREAQSSARLNHPHIARAFDLDTSGSIHFIVMEYIDGTDLHARVKQQGPLPVRDAADFIRQAALGLTPPPSSESRSTTRLPNVSPKHAAPSSESGGIVINTNPLPGPSKTAASDIRRPPVSLPAVNQRTATRAAASSSWLSRRYAGLPLLVWLASGLLLAVPLLVGGWLWVGRSGQQAPEDDVVEATDMPTDADGSAVEEPSAKAKPATAVKTKPSAKSKSRPPSRKKPTKPTDEPSDPSPLDGLDKLTPAPSGK